jgi:hypothetical protein
MGFLLNGDKMKTYKCRCTKRTKKWTKIKTHGPFRAAEIYAGVDKLDYPDIVTVMNHGRYRVHIDKTYYVLTA